MPKKKNNLSYIQQYLFDSYDYLEKLGVKPFLIGSTLLQLIRSGDFIERHQMDREINFGCLAENLTPERLEKIRKDNGYYETITGFALGGILFDKLSRDPNSQEPWGRKAFTLLVLFYPTEYKRFEDLGSGRCLSWNKEHLEKFDHIIWKGKRLRVPSNPKDWLSHYFGKDWRKEKLDWHWAKDANNFEAIVSHYNLSKG